MRLSSVYTVYDHATPKNERAPVYFYTQCYCYVFIVTVMIMAVCSVSVYNMVFVDVCRTGCARD